MDFFQIVTSLQENWYGQVAVIFFATVMVNFLIVKTLKNLDKTLDANRDIWKHALLKSAYIPIRLVGWLIGLTLILKTLYENDILQILSSIFPQFRKIAFVLVLTLFLHRLIENIYQTLLASAKNPNSDQLSNRFNKLDVSSIEAIAKLTKISVVIIATLIILQALGYSISGILAFGGMGGIAVGFAAKDLLANFFGGLIIYLDKPFKAGDWIRSPDRQIEGRVEHIGWRISRIRTFDKRPLYVPNSLFTNVIVENPSRMSHGRIKETVGIRYDDWRKMEIILTKVNEMLVEHPLIDTDEPTICHFNKFNDSSLDFIVYAHTKTTERVAFHTVKQDVLLKIFAIIDEQEAEIAFPTQTLLIPNESDSSVNALINNPNN